MTPPQYTVALTVKGSTEPKTLTYGYSKAYRKWQFKTPTINLIVPCKGKEQGHKIANLIVGSFKRAGTIDGLCRKNIDMAMQPVEE